MNQSFFIPCPVCRSAAKATGEYPVGQDIPVECIFNANHRSTVPFSRLNLWTCDCCHSLVSSDQTSVDRTCPFCSLQKPVPGIEHPSACPGCGCRFVSVNDPNPVCPLCGCSVTNTAREILFDMPGTMVVFRHPLKAIAADSVLNVPEGCLFCLVPEGLAEPLILSPGRYAMSVLCPQTRMSTCVPADLFIIRRTPIDMNWGTLEKIRVIDPIARVPVFIGASGVCRIAVTDPDRLIAEVRSCQARQQTLDVRKLLFGELKKHLQPVITECRITLRELDSFLAHPLSEKLLPRIDSGFSPLGLSLAAFTITARPEDQNTFHYDTVLAGKSSWDCPACGAQEIFSGLCPACYSPQPLSWVCPTCQKSLCTSVCPDCASLPPRSWFLRQRQVHPTDPADTQAPGVPSEDFGSSADLLDDWS